MNFSKNDCTGFTLIEIVVTIALISIMAGMAIILMPTHTINLPAAAIQLQYDLRYVQTLAITNGQRYRFSKLSANSYQIKDNSGNLVPFPATGSTTMSMSQGITFGSFVNLPYDLVTFDSNGAPYVDAATPGTALNATATIPITGGGQVKSIQIMPQTGWIQVI